MGQILGLMLQATFGQYLQDRIHELRALENSLGDAVVEVREVSATEVVGEVGGRELEFLLAETLGKLKRASLTSRELELPAS